jgi:DNA-binding LacI/PurR family transcriptional regulator
MITRYEVQTQEEVTQKKYKKIAESLRQRIKNGGFVRGDLLPSSKILSLEYETTPVTVDKALGLLVQDGLVERTPGVGTIVLPTFGRNLATSSTSVGLIGALLQAQTESRYWERLLEGVSDVLRPQGIATLIGYHNQDITTACEHLDLFKQQGVQIVLFTPLDRENKALYESDNKILLEYIDTLGMQVIMLDRYIESMAGHVISEYCYAQGRQLVEQVYDQGLTNQVCISTDYVSVIGAREKAFLDGLSAKGVKNPKSRLVHIPLIKFQHRDYDQIALLLQETIEEADVLVSLNSRIFNTLLYMQAKKGLDMFKNRDPKFAGFVDIELMDLDGVVGYVEQPIREMGHAAGRMVQYLLEEQPLEYLHSLVPCELRMLEVSL